MTNLSGLTGVRETWQSTRDDQNTCRVHRKSKSGRESNESASSVFLVEKESATGDSQRDHIFKKLAVAMRLKLLDSANQMSYYASSNLKIN